MVQIFKMVQPLFAVAEEAENLHVNLCYHPTYGDNRTFLIFKNFHFSRRSKLSVFETDIKILPNAILRLRLRQNIPILHSECS